MKGALIILAFTVLVGFMLWLWDFVGRRRQSPPQPEPDADVPQVTEGECCGMHIVCEKDSLSPFTSEIVYYDDEELDRFRGRSPQQYTEEEVEEFRDVMLTMRPEEIAGWSRSLQLRQVQLPESVRQELLLIVSEARKKQMNLN